MAKLITETDFESQVLESEQLVVVDFFANWCGPCKAIAPILDELTTEFNGKAEIFKIDVEKSGAMARQYGIRSIPALIFFKDGEVVDKEHAYVVLDDGTEHRIDHINFLTEALNLRRDAALNGTLTEHNGQPAKVVGVHIQGNAVWLSLEMQESGNISRIPYMQFADITTDRTSAVGHYIGFYADGEFNPRGRIEAIHTEGGSNYAVINGVNHHVRELSELVTAINRREDGTVVKHNGEDAHIVGVRIQNGQVRVSLQIIETREFRIVPYSELS
jgi:thioredoxin 1